MATVTTTSKNLRYHMGLQNGGSRYIDIENPITDATAISTNIQALNSSISGGLSGILVGEDFFNGDTTAVVTGITSAEIIEVQKTTTTNTVFIE